MQSAETFFCLLSFWFQPFCCWGYRIFPWEHIGVMGGHQNGTMGVTVDWFCIKGACLPARTRFFLDTFFHLGYCHSGTISRFRATTALASRLDDNIYILGSVSPRLRWERERLFFKISFFRVPHHVHCAFACLAYNILCLRSQRGTRLVRSCGATRKMAGDIFQSTSSPGYFAAR